MNKLILASGSPRRQEMLSNLDIKLEVIPPKSESLPNPDEKPWEYAKRVSREKMEEINNKTDKSKPSFILAADTIVVLKNEILGKPENIQQWQEYLEKLSDTWHKVYTGYTLKCPKKIYSRVIKSKVRFTKISHDQLEWYISTGEGTDKAGGYAIQGKGAVFIKEIRGSFTNIIGLPLSEVVEDLNKCSFFSLQ